MGVNLLKPDPSEQALLYWLATVEQSINHPFALAILEYAAERGIEHRPAHSRSPAGVVIFRGKNILVAVLGI
ncbi:hypothetical protein [uncultured Thermosynechococcus sp.]|uniref:hypothetical protein n=1 Tax=uncultured Thermosynechococcus sp. TaxID=436945 RepID=UPI00262832AC|nr:hypothetical protein [uncultured Thermosynechococcus sp.]